MLDLVSLGELLVDFTPAGTSENGVPLFERNPGGGPANLACTAAKLGCKTAFIGKVGDDLFGRALKQTLEDNRVNTQNLLLSKDYKTTLAFVQLDEKGERDFSFYRQNGADTMLTAEEVDLSLIEGCRYFFFSSVLMTEGTSREASFRLAELARSKGITIVFDPNLRLNLWSDPQEARKLVLKALRLAHIVKVSEEELSFLAEEEDLEKAARRFMELYRLEALLVTMGSRGCQLFTKFCQVLVDGFRVDTIDTTAAGDSFTGAFISRLVEAGKGIQACTKEELTAMVRFANAVGALTTTKKGAIPALPTAEEAEALLEQQKSMV